MTIWLSIDAGSRRWNNFPKAPSFRALLIYRSDSARGKLSTVTGAVLDAGVWANAAILVARTNAVLIVRLRPLITILLLTVRRFFQRPGAPTSSRRTLSSARRSAP